MGWRAKLVFLLMVYAAGFATAIYFLAPTPDTSSQGTFQTSIPGTTFDKQAFTKSVNAGLHKGVDLTKEIAHQASTLIKEKVEEMQTNDKNHS